MLQLLVFLALTLPLAASAQTAAPPMMTHHHEMTMSGGAGAPTQPGQSAFAAIQEIVTIFETDPKTDWSKVDIEALRRHLIDMDNVTLRAEVKAEPVEGGMRFVVTGSGDVRDSIRRMTSAHAATMNGAGGWTFKAEQTAEGDQLTVLVPAAGPRSNSRRSASSA